MLLLDRSNKALGIVTVSKGGTTGTVIDTKLIIQYALKTNAHGIILAHNHPSGNLNPSEADLNITERIKNACEAVEISLIDHLVISSTEEYQSILQINISLLYRICMQPGCINVFARRIFRRVPHSLGVLLNLQELRVFVGPSTTTHCNYCNTCQYVLLCS